ncbi:MAG: hypothetical protein WC907_01730 [Acholeplasmataceae bacterium]
MRKIIRAFVLIFVFIILLASCVKDPNPGGGNGGDDNNGGGVGNQEEIFD